MHCYHCDFFLPSYGSDLQSQLENNYHRCAHSCRDDNQGEYNRQVVVVKDKNLFFFFNLPLPFLQNLFFGIRNSPKKNLDVLKSGKSLSTGFLYAFSCLLHVHPSLVQSSRSVVGSPTQKDRLMERLSLEQKQYRTGILTPT